MAAEDPAAIERRMYVDMHLGGVDDPSLSIAELRYMGGGGVNAHKAAQATSISESAGAPFVKKGDLVVNVKDYGARGDGVTDDTAAIQAALDATPVGSTTFFPNGNYKATATLTRRRGRRIQGSGYLVRVDALTGYNSVGYSDLANITGAVIRSTVTTGTALTLEVGAYNQGGCPIDGLILVGPGSGTSTGYDEGDGTRAVLDAHGGQFAVHNFSIGVRLAVVENSSWESLVIRACATAGSFITDTNANVLRVDISCCSNGLTLDTTTVNNTLIGFIAQNNLNTSIYINGYGNKLVAPYFENSASVGPAISVLDSLGTVIESPSFNNPADDVTISVNGKSTQVLAPNVKGGTITISNAGVGSVFIGDFLTNITFTDIGTKTNYLDTGNQKTKLSGIVRVGESTGQSVVEVNGSSSSTKSVSFMTAGVLRWVVRSNAIAEGGSNAGSDLEFVARDDAGGPLNTTTIRRTDGRITAPSGIVTGKYATGSRPSATTLGSGAQVFDTTLNKPIWSDGTSWRDAAGTVV